MAGEVDGRTARWATHRDAQRLRIVEAAIACYDEGNLEATLQEIGARAGVSRSVLYRQFADRADLDQAVQEHVLAHLWNLLAPTLTVADTVRETLRRPIEAYVDWVLAHPHLLRIAERDVLGTNARDRALRQVAAAVGEALVLWFGAAGARVTEADRLATDPLAFGLVSAMHATVTRWVELGAKVPNRDHLIELAADAAWALVDVRLRAYGLDVDPDAPIEAWLPPRP